MKNRVKHKFELSLVFLIHHWFFISVYLSVEFTNNNTWQTLLLVHSLVTWHLIRRWSAGNEYISWEASTLTIAPFLFWGLSCKQAYTCHNLGCIACVEIHVWHWLTHVVIPLEENLAIWSSKLIPPTPITSIWSAGLFKVLQFRNRATF